MSDLLIDYTNSKTLFSAEVTETWENVDHSHAHYVVICAPAFQVKVHAWSGANGVWVTNYCNVSQFNGTGNGDSDAHWTSKSEMRVDVSTAATGNDDKYFCHCCSKPSGSTGTEDWSNNHYWVLWFEGDKGKNAGSSLDLDTYGKYSVEVTLWGINKYTENYYTTSCKGQPIRAIYVDYWNIEATGRTYSKRSDCLAQQSCKNLKGILIQSDRTKLVNSQIHWDNYDQISICAHNDMDYITREGGQNENQ